MQVSDNHHLAGPAVEAKREPPPVIDQHKVFGGLAALLGTEPEFVPHAIFGAHQLPRSRLSHRKQVSYSLLRNGTAAKQRIGLDGLRINGGSNLTAKGVDGSSTQMRQLSEKA